MFHAHEAAVCQKPLQEGGDSEPIAAATPAPPPTPAGLEGIDERRDAAAAAAASAEVPVPKRLRIERVVHAGGTCPFLELGVRFFAPREIACLHGFPGTFSFPPGVTDKQARRTLGNSLSVTVVSALLDYLLPRHMTAAGRGKGGDGAPAGHVA